MAMSSDGHGRDAKSPSLIKQAVHRLQQIANTALSDEIRQKTSLALLDYLGAIACGLEAPWASRICAYGRMRQSAPESHAWGINENISSDRAAFVNATLAHSAIRDDMHLKSNSHIGSIIISAAIALGQRDKWTGEQLLKAIVGGYEVAAILGSSVQQSPEYNRHIRPSGIVGAFGAAAAAVTANMVKAQISEDVAINALSFAANMASGFNEWAWSGGEEIYVEMGTASQAGLNAFDLAQVGMLCSETLLQGRAGLFAALGASKGETMFKQGLERPIGQGTLDVRFKPAPGCNYAQTPLAVALRMAQRHNLKRGTIKSVNVICTSGAKNYPGCDNPGPFSTVQQTKMSIQFGVCAVLLHSEISESLFKRFGDAEIETMASECIVQAGSEFDQDFAEGRQPARIEIGLDDGSIVKEDLADVPWLNGQAVISRFHQEFGALPTSGATVDKLVHAIQHLETIPDVSQVTALFKQADAL